MTYPIALQIRRLEPSEWPHIAEKYTAEFGNRMPTDSTQSTFLGIFLDDELIGYSHVESVVHLNAIFIEPEHRHRAVTEALFEMIDGEVPVGWPLIILPRSTVPETAQELGIQGTAGNQHLAKGLLNLLLTE
jgi:hypothetical protein